MTGRLIETLLRQATAKGSRSDALHPLAWLIGLTLAALLGCPVAGMGAGITIGVAGFAGVEVLVYLGAYLYLMARNPDALRSERFTLSKIAIEKSARGDDLTGFVEEPRALLKAPSSKHSEDQS